MACIWGHPLHSRCNIFSYKLNDTKYHDGVCLAFTRLSPLKKDVENELVENEAIWYWELAVIWKAYWKNNQRQSRFNRLQQLFSIPCWRPTMKRLFQRKGCQRHQRKQMLIANEFLQLAAGAVSHFDEDDGTSLWISKQSWNYQQRFVALSHLIRLLKRKSTVCYLLGFAPNLSAIYQRTQWATTMTQLTCTNSNLATSANNNPLCQHLYFFFFRSLGGGSLGASIEFWHSCSQRSIVLYFGKDKTGAAVPKLECFRLLVVKLMLTLSL